ncbi:uncharacterized protein LOC119724867 [Patiria miniata]|uniref:Uncharacterized protein n=1 Tax=Patiria miniata TaxID=46514 RepID=A0A913ZJT7_PATMI|nr:uncharacterized protein LOC119724867 [Patiria miniata]
MSTIPGGCFVAPDSLRRLNQLQKQHAREAKMQQAGNAQQTPQSPPVSPPVSPPILPPVDHARSNTFAHLITTVPLRLSEIIGRTRSMSSPQSTPPSTPPLSPRMPRSISKEAINVPDSEAINIPNRREEARNRNPLSESI